MSFAILVACALILGSVYGQGNECDRKPSRTSSNPTPGDNGFRIVIPDKTLPNSYRPGQTYSVRILGSHGRQKFTDFMLVAVGEGSRDEATRGIFKISSDDEVKFDDTCENIITRRYPYPSRVSNVSVSWQAPPSGSGCVEFRATVVQLQDIWYKDDGGLTQVLCEEVEIETTTPLPECNACGVAKYSLEFQGLWSRQTHPKDFPSGHYEPLLHWSNIVGASHTKDYSIWEYGGLSTNGVKEVCEHGQVRILEREIWGNARHVRTVIITPGLWGVTQIVKKATARFSVDKKNHLMSMVTMLGPSPDWCTGVSNLNLCMPNGTWAGDRDIPLYPWDAGTDSGITYISPNLPTIPRAPIQPITNTRPDNPRAPFYGKHPVKPVAILRIRRLPPRGPACEEDDGEVFSNTFGGNNDMEKKIMMDKELMMKCRMSNWTEWSDCSVTCGIGMRFRMRQYLMPGVDAMCGLTLKETDRCIAPENECEDAGTICATTPYSDWAPCSVTCGNGFTMRQRHFLNPMGELKCNKQLVEKRMCVATVESCAEAETGKDWAAICSLPKVVGRCRAHHNRWYFDTVMGKCLPFVYGGCKGNQNRFMTLTECQDRCSSLAGSVEPVEGFTDRPPTAAATKRPRRKKDRKRPRKPKTGNEIDCIVTEWSAWSACSTSCGRGRTERVRMIKRDSANGGRRCPRRLRQRKKCPTPRKKCPVDCQLGEWTEWTSCSKTCGINSLQERMKNVIKKPRRGGAPCGPRLERRYCLKPDCPSK